MNISSTVLTLLEKERVERKFETMNELILYLLVQVPRDQQEQQQQSPLPRKKRRKDLPAAVRNMVWTTFVGQDVGLSKCWVCKKETISRANFECAHIQAVSQGGTDELSNLRPSCSLCNKSIGNQNVNDFMSCYGINNCKSPYFPIS